MSNNQNNDVETKKTYFDNWLETQQSWMNSWQENYRQMQENYNGTEAFRKSTEAFGGWMKGQAENAQGTAEGVRQDAENTMNNATRKASDFFTNWVGMQNQVINTWTNAGKQYWDMMNGMRQNGFNGSGNWMNGAGGLGQSFNQGMMGWNRLANESSKWWNSTLQNFQQNTELYNNLNETWAPIWKNLQDGQFNAEQWAASFQPQRMKEMTDKIFGFNSESFFNAFGQQTQDLAKNWQEQGEKFRDGQFQNLKENLNTWTDSYAQLRNSYRPFFTMAQPGAERDMAEQALNGMDLTANYASRGAQLQYHYYRTAENAWKALGEKVKAKMERNEKYADFNEFYAEWLKTFEQSYLELFNSNEYGKVQGEMMNIGLDLKTIWEQNWETALKDLPVVRRSQMDEVYKANYDLRKRVTDLENSIEELRTQKQEATPQPNQDNQMNGTAQVQNDQPGNEGSNKGPQARKAGK